jgi:hypothetical protein
LADGKSSWHLFRQKSFQEFLSARLTAGWLIRSPQTGCRQIVTAGESLVLYGGDEPVIGFTSDIGAARSSAFHGRH